MIHFTNLELSKNDFSSQPWTAVIETVNDKECWRYSSAFLSKAKEAEVSGNLTLEQVFVFLAVVTDLHLDLDAPNDPFGKMQFSFNSQQVDLLCELVAEVDDPELQARMADLVWSFQREGNPIMREVAVNAYLASATRTEDPKNWVSCERSIERAFQIALNSKLFPTVFKHIEEVLARMNGEDPLFLSAKLLRLLYQHGAGDPIKYATLAEKLARHLEATPTWYIAREYWDIAADWHKRSKNQESRRLALLSSAETYVKESESAFVWSPTPYMVSSSFLQHAVEAFRRIPDTQERVESLHKRLLENQVKSLDEMAVISTDPIDITEIVEQAVAKVQGRSLQESLFALALLTKPANATQLRQAAEKQSKDFVFSSLLPVKIMNAMGRTIACELKVHSSDPEVTAKQNEEALLDKMFQNASHSWQLQVQACTEPARQQINSEHNVRIEDFLGIVSNNPFVPPGRELLYAQGLSAGMSGDFLIAIHLLIPQVEHSIRYILAQQGKLTTAIDGDGIQTEFDLNKTLKAPQYKEILTQVFGEDLMFNLRGLLVERFGANLRNDMAHGLLASDQFYSAPSCYLWWLVLRLCCFPVIAAQLQAQQVVEDGNNKKASSS